MVKSYIEVLVINLKRGMRATNTRESKWSVSGGGSPIKYLGWEEGTASPRYV